MRPSFASYIVFISLKQVVEVCWLEYSWSGIGLKGKKRECQIKIKRKYYVPNPNCHVLWALSLWANPTNNGEGSSKPRHYLLMLGRERYFWMSSGWMSPQILSSLHWVLYRLHLCDDHPFRLVTCFEDVHFHWLYWKGIGHWDIEMYIYKGCWILDKVLRTSMFYLDTPSIGQMWYMDIRFHQFPHSPFVFTLFFHFSIFYGLLICSRKQHATFHNKLFWKRPGFMNLQLHSPQTSGLSNNIHVIAYSLSQIIFLDLTWIM